MFRALRYRDFRLLWFGQTGHSLSLWMDQVARAVLILQLTDSAIALSLVIATRLAPILLLGLVGGVVADRYDRKRILMWTQIVSLGTHVFIGVMAVTGMVEIWHVFATAFIAGTAMAFNQPVRQSLIPLTVPREDLMNAIALNQTALSFMRIGGASLAGILVGFFSVGTVYLINAGIYVAVIATTLMMAIPSGRGKSKQTTSMWGDLKEGFVYIKANPDLRITIGLALILFILGFPYQQVFTPLLATKTLDMGDSGVGYLAAATGVGALLGSLFLAWKSNVRRPGIQLMINMLIFGGALVVISLQETVIGTMVLLALAGSMSVTYMAFTNAILFAKSDPAMHGRVMSLMSLDRGLIPLGAIAAGMLASSLGIRPGLFTMGAAILVISAVILLVGGKRLATIESDPTMSLRRGGGHGRAPEPEPSPAAPAPGR